MGSTAAHDPQVIVEDGGHEKCAALIYQVPAIPGRLFREHRKGIYTVTAGISIGESLVGEDA